MSLSETSSLKEIANLNVPWEDAYGYAQAVKVGNTIYVSGQLSHDAEGKLIGAAPLDAAGRPSDFSNMRLQMQTTYENARRLLSHFGATFDQVVEETLFVLDVPAAFAAAGDVRRDIYGTTPRVASNLIGVSRLAFPEQLIEITYRVDLSVASK